VDSIQPERSETAARGLRRVSLTQWIVIAAVIGVLLGVFFPAFAVKLDPFSQIFLRMIKSLIVPLIFSTLVVGIAGHGDDMKKVGRLALRSFIYFELVTSGALVIGLTAVNLVKPGAGVSLGAATAKTGAELASHPVTFGGVLEHMVPQSFFEAAYHNEVLQVVFFAILFAVALTRQKGENKQRMLHFCASLSDLMFKFTEIVMAYAPIGIGAALAVTVGHSGIGVLMGLGKLVLTLYGALIVFVLCVMLPIAIFTRIPLRAFLKAIRQPALIAFSTSSSEAALPLAMERMEQIGVPSRIVAFVMPTGYSFNLDGSTLYLAVAAVFAAQAGGIHMTLGQQIVMMLTLMLTSKGVAAVPRASLVILSGALAMFGLPLEAVAVILGVDAFMDMARTSVNLIGNCLASAVMARWEGDMPPTPRRAVVAAAETV
jgi:proton glutamate symport protein